MNKLENIRIFDIHTHIMDNVDDGSKNIEQSIKILREAEKVGVKDIILTPHHYKTVFENSKVTLLSKYKELLNVIEKENIDCDNEKCNTEEDYYKNTLGFGGRFLFAENLEEGRLMVAGNRGFLPVERVGTLPPCGTGVKRLPVMERGQQLKRNYCLFWVKENASYYIEEFAEILRKLLKE